MGYKRLIDNAAPNRFYASGNWWLATQKEGKYGDNYRAANPKPGPEHDAAFYDFDIPSTKDYDVFYWHPIGGSRSMPFGVWSPSHVDAGPNGWVWKDIDLQQHYGKWRYIGRYRMVGGSKWNVGCSRLCTGFGVALADAVWVGEVVDDTFTQLLNSTRMLVGPSPLTGVQPVRITGYNALLWAGDYPFGCPPGRDSITGKVLGDSLHKGVDYGRWSGPRDEQSRGAPIYSWARGQMLYNRYHAGGYNRYIGVYYPDAGPNGKTVEYGHLLNGSVQLSVGQWFEPGTFLARIGTWEDGLTYSHVHDRCGDGKITTHIGSCGDEPPIRTWRALGLPENRL